MTPAVRKLLAGNFLSQIGSGLTMPLLIVYLGQVRGMGTAVAGLVVAYMSVVGLALLPISGTLVDRIGPKPVLLCGLVVEALGVGLLTRVETEGTAFAVATIVAAGGAFTWGPQSSLLGRLTEPEQRQRVFGIQFMLLNLGLGIGGIISALIVDVSEPSTFAWLYSLDALTYLGYVAVLATLPGIGVGPAPAYPVGADGGHGAVGEDGADGRGGYREVLRDRVLLRIVVLGLVLFTCGYGSIEVGLPVMITIVNGLSVSWVAIAYTVNTATVVAMQLVSLRFMRGRSRSGVMALVGVLWAASWLITGASGLLPTPVAIGAICLGTLVFAVGETLWSPIVPALINDLAPDRLRGRYNSLQGLVWGVSGALGPGLTALLLGAGLVSLWIGLVVVGCTAAAVMALRLRSHLTPELDGRVPDTVAGGTMTP